MGGAGSSRWGSHIRKSTVEDCLILTPKPLRKALACGLQCSGKIRWTLDGEPFASLSYITVSLNGKVAVRLTYLKTMDGTKERMNYLIRLVSSQAPFGGVRWYFLCPLAVNGLVCSRKAIKLFLRGDSSYFGCRHCNDLTYVSAQGSHKLDSFYTQVSRMLGNRWTPNQIKAALR
jgi:hypothetical protein